MDCNLAESFYSVNDQLGVEGDYNDDYDSVPQAQQPRRQQTRPSQPQAPSQAQQQTVPDLEVISVGQEPARPQTRNDRPAARPQSAVRQPQGPETSSGLASQGQKRRPGNSPRQQPTRSSQQTRDQQTQPLSPQVSKAPGRNQQRDNRPGNGPSLRPASKPQRQQGRPNQVQLNPVRKQSQPSRSQSGGNNRRPQQAAQPVRNVSPSPSQQQQPSQGARAPQQGGRPKKTQLTLNPVRPIQAPQAGTNNNDGEEPAYSDNNSLDGQFASRGKTSLKQPHSSQNQNQGPAQTTSSRRNKRPQASQGQTQPGRTQQPVIAKPANRARPRPQKRPSQPAQRPANRQTQDRPDSSSGFASQGQTQPGRPQQPVIAKPANRARPRPQKRPSQRKNINPSQVDIVQYDATLGGEDDDLDNDVPILFADPFQDIQVPEGPNRLYEAPQFGFRFF